MILAVAVCLAASWSSLAVDGSSDERANVRKAGRRAREASRRAAFLKDLFRDAWRLDQRLSALDRVSDVKLTGQEYLPGQMRQERKELKEDEETSQRLAAREDARKARAARQRQTEKARRVVARRKKRIRAF